MLIELFIAWRANDISNSARRMRYDSSDEVGEAITAWLERRAIKRELKKLNQEPLDIERPVRLDTSKQKAKSGKRKRGT